MKHSVILIVGDAAPKYAELSNNEIAELWRDVQARCLPKVMLGWFDERNKFCQMAKRGTHDFKCLLMLRQRDEINQRINL